MKTLSDYRDLTEYVKVIDTLLMNYVKTDEYLTAPEQERNMIVDGCSELKENISYL